MEKSYKTTLLSDNRAVKQALARKSAAADESGNCGFFTHTDYSLQAFTKV